jgi:hypothetical protein
MSDFWEGFWMAIPQKWPDLTFLGWMVGGLTMVMVGSVMILLVLIFVFWIKDVVNR